MDKKKYYGRSNTCLKKPDGRKNYVIKGNTKEQEVLKELEKDEE